MALIFLDITGAFDRAWHSAILYALHKKQCPTYILLLKFIQSLLTNRLASLYCKKGQEMHQLTQITPQGLMLFPFVWNIFIDSLLTPFHTQAYAENICILLPYSKKDLASKIKQQYKQQ